MMLWRDTSRPEQREYEEAAKAKKKGDKMKGHKKDSKKETGG